MKRLFPVVPAMLLLLLCAHGAQKESPRTPAVQSAAFYVATNGNDAWSGKQPDAEPGKADGPFATLPRALRAARESRQQPGSAASHASTIFIRGGLYFLNAPLG